MTAEQHMAAIKLSTMAALKAGKCSLPEIIGNLELCKINADRFVYESAKSPIISAPAMPPNGIELPPRN